MRGKIIKGVGGFYYVYCEDNIIYECKAKGIFRKEDVKPCVGDDVLIDITHDIDKEGNIIEILPRRTHIKRPFVSNIDKIVIVLSVKDPVPSFYLLDKMILYFENLSIKPSICINKIDLDEKNRIQKEVINIYSKIGYEIFCIDTKKQRTLHKFKEAMKGSVFALCGASGVGKSSITNALQNNIEMETGSTSKKLKRGKNTTRHTQLIHIEGDTFITDTPGFSSFELTEVSLEDLPYLFREFRPYLDKCYFANCAHNKEDKCAIKEQVAIGNISQSRYDSYIKLYNCIKEKREY